MKRDVPKQWQARSTWNGETGEVVTGPIAPTEKFDDLLVKFGYDPEATEIVGKVNQWRKELPNGEFLVSYFFAVQSRESNLDLPALYATARKKQRQPLKHERKQRTTVVCLSDVQAGKTSHRGGTPELLERLLEKRELLDKHLKSVKPDSLVLAEGGDLFENFESGGNPMFTNDLSLAQQMDLAGTEVYEFAALMARHGHVDVMAVTSNHTAWRRGKQDLGNPQDDLGLHVHRQVEKLAKASGLDVDYHYPHLFAEATTLDVRGTVLGMVHGNQFGPGAQNAIKWWQGQQHGGQPIGAADLLLSGHYHHFAMTSTGRNPYTNRMKWWLQMPTLDSGSTWYRNIAGDDSDTGLLVFDITDDGFDLQSLTIL